MLKGILKLDWSNLSVDDRLAAIDKMAAADADQLAFRQLLEQHPQARLVIAQHCPHSEIRAELIKPLSEAEQADLIAGVAFVDTRQLIAERLESEECLQHARHNLKGKDKNAEKIIKAKLDTLHVQQRSDEEHAIEALFVCKKMELLATEEWQHDSPAKFSVWQQRWDAFEFKPAASVKQRYATALKIVADQVEATAGLEDSSTKLQKTAQKLQTLCFDFAGQSLDSISDQIDGYQDKLKALQKKWVKHSKSVEPDLTADKQFSLAKNAIVSALEFATTLGASEQLTIKKLTATIKKIAWPKEYPDLQIRIDANAALESLKQQQAEDKKNALAKLKKLHSRINRLLGTTERGDLNIAKRELTAVTKVVTKYQGNDKASLQERLEKANAAVQKMADWKEFATAPKVLELCEAMQKLTESKAHPDKLASDIATLQNSWKALGQSASGDENWQRFKQAADKAYEPCAVFFKQRRKIRAENLKQREPNVQQMRDLLENTDWDAPDFKDIEKQLQNIANSWQKIKDVERGPGQKQWKRLSKIRSKIMDKLGVTYDANIEIKNRIVEQGNAMLESDLNEESFAKLQLIQSRWKKVGVTRRKQDQIAWKKFKKTTDAIYEKIQEVRKGKRAEEDSQLKAYRDIIREIQQLSKSANNLADADKSFDGLQNDYAALPELPKGLPENLLKRLQSDYHRAGDAYGQARDRIKRAGQAKVLDLLAEKATICAKLEQAGDSPKSSKLREAIDAIELTDNKLNKRFDKRLKAALNADRQQFTEQRRMLCIDLEILLGKDSPKEDASLRMKVQLERMQKQGIGHDQTNKTNAIDEMKIDWLCLPGAESEEQKLLDKRFAKLIMK